MCLHWLPKPYFHLQLTSIHVSHISNTLTEKYDQSLKKYASQRPPRRFYGINRKAETPISPSASSPWQEKGKIQSSRFIALLLLAASKVDDRRLALDGGTGGSLRTGEGVRLALPRPA